MLWNHGSHTQPSPGERALRELLARYSAGLTRRFRITGRPENRLGAARGERVERYLRADRLNALRLAAALQLERRRMPAAGRSGPSFCMQNDGPARR
jgi:hypothetical protein